MRGDEGFISSKCAIPALSRVLVRWVTHLSCKCGGCFGVRSSVEVDCLEIGDKLKL